MLIPKKGQGADRQRGRQTADAGDALKVQSFVAQAAVELSRRRAAVNIILHEIYLFYSLPVVLTIKPV